MEGGHYQGWFTLVDFGFSNDSHESIGEVNSDFSSASSSDMGMNKDELLIIDIPQGVMSIERM